MFVEMDVLLLSLMFRFVKKLCVLCCWKFWKLLNVIEVSLLRLMR